TIERENLQQNCSIVGDYLLKGLNNLQEKYECIGDVRGCGLMVGIDLVKNREKKEPDSELTSQIHEVSKDLGLIIGKGGLYRNILRIKPLLCITKADVDFIIQVLDFALSSY
ncbi:MAG: aminotransferase class III-fold pyridoxal phosphate-dependent enzyme, partial [Okeania sp. SIO2D1]|nr:aminotransferase class III-fold pyridoxal phosphate-dependent enzyme [Okeania sp. SIO2D1]